MKCSRCGTPIEKPDCIFGADCTRCEVCHREESRLAREIGNRMEADFWANRKSVGTGR